MIDLKNATYGSKEMKIALWANPFDMLTLPRIFIWIQNFMLDKLFESFRSTVM